MTDGSQLTTFDELSASNRLSGPSDFDDGRCAENDDNTMGRTGPTNCQSHITIPAGTKPGIYALYWVWDFTKLTAVDPSYLELYTSCMDVEVVAGGQEASTGNQGSVAPAPAASSPAGNVAKPNVVTSTRVHTKTVTGPVVKITRQLTTPPARAEDVVLTTLWTEKFITVTKTVIA